MEAGRIRHPYQGLAEHEQAWVRDRTWWYRGVATVAAGDVVTFARLDTVATIFFDGHEVARHANQFVPLRFVISKDQAGDHEVLVRLDPPLRGLTEPSVPASTRAQMSAFFADARSTGENSESNEDKPRNPEDTPLGAPTMNLAATRRRKATLSWGWDFAPEVTSVGVSGPVTVTKPGIEHLDLATQTLTFSKRTDAGGAMGWTRSTQPDMTEKSNPVSPSIDAAVSDGFSRTIAHVQIRVVVSEGCPAKQVHWELLGIPDEPLATGTATVVDGAATADVTVENVPVWWPIGEGRQDFLKLRATPIISGDPAETTTRRVAIRTVEIDQGKRSDGGGRRMRFIVNGRPVFARGSCLVPPDMLVGSEPEGTETRLVDQARSMGHTMIRIWGGGLYGSEEFMNRCDELGILVIQDFPFASIEYPDDDDSLRAEIHREVREAVMRLRRHPSLVCFAGNNEVQAVHQAIWKSLDGDGWGRRFFDDIIPQIVHELAPEIPYRPSSPWGENDPAGINGVRDGDRHAWEGWHGGDFGAGGQEAYATQTEAAHFWRYDHDTGSFISEYGFCGAPELATLRRWSDGPVELGSRQLRQRIKDTPKDKGAGLIELEFGPTVTIESWAVAFAMLQAEAVAYGTSHYRRQQPNCSGALLWQFNEPWPGISWSLIDYDGVPKAAAFAARRVLQPVLVSIAGGRDGVPAEVWVTNSSPVTFTGTIRARLLEVASGSVRDEVRVDIAIGAGASKKVGTFASISPHEVIGRVTVENASGAWGSPRVLFAHAKELGFTGTPEIVSVEATDIPESGAEYIAGHRNWQWTRTVCVRSEEPAYAAHVCVPGRELDIAVSDNWFDILPGDDLSVTVVGVGEPPSDTEFRINSLILGPAE